jgi:cell volume regulation protein A
VPKARELFEVAFVVVLASLVLQGATMVRAARLFGVNLPDAADEPAARRLFGDFVLDGSAPVQDLCLFYGLDVPEHPGTLAQWIETRLRRPPVVGDRLDWSGASFSVRQMDGAQVLRVGLSLGAPR